MHIPNHRSPLVPASIMTSSPGTIQHSDESCPAGGTAPRSGTRTPRRVQWASADAVRVDDNRETSPRESVHALDEMGLDPTAFETLRNALEKHQSKERLPSESGTQERRSTALPSIPPQTVVPRRSGTSGPASQHNPFTSPPVVLSGLPRTHVHSDNPYPTTSAPQIQISESRGTGSSSMEQSSPTVDDIDVHLSSSTLVAQRTHDVPGEVWIDPLEREGLPVHAPIPNALRRRSTWARGSRDEGAISGERHIERLAEYQAAGVVRAHTRRGWGWLHRSPNGKKASKSKGVHEGEKGKEDQSRRETDEKGKATKHNHHRRRHTHSDTENDTDFTDGEPHRPGRVRKGVPGSWLSPVMHLPHVHIHHGQQHHAEDHLRGHPHGPKFGNGVLSTLLALYGHDHEHDDEGSASGASTPGGGSRASSDAGSEEGILPKPDRPWLSDQHDNHDHSSSKGPKDVKDKRTGKFSLGRSLKGGSASSILAHLRTPSLPPTTAALIAGASTLTGAAAPQQATLAPNLKKAGYNLMRYTVEEVPKVVERTPNVIHRGLRRARSTDTGIATTYHRAGEENEREADLPDTPGATIVASPTGDSEGPEDRPKGGHEHPVSTPGERKGWTGRLKDLPLVMHLSPGHLRVLSPSHPGTERGFNTPGESGTATPGTASMGGTPVDEFGEKDYFDLKHIEKETQRIKEQERKERKEREKQREKEIRRKRRKAEVYITRHVAEILQRQEFIMKLARAMMMFGGPSHRLASQIQSTGRVLDLELSCMYLPDVMLISFEDSATGTSNVKFIRQGSALDLEKLGEAHSLYWNVIHDTMSVSAASAALDVLMRKEPLYNFIQLTIVGGMCSASICSVAFSGSFIDCLASAPLGALLVAIQLIGVRNELYVNVFEITIATLLSFLSAALASTKHFCYSAVASSSVVLILPGFIVLSGSLELSSRSLVAGAVRLCFALMYSLFLGFGLAIGAQIYQRILGRSIIGPIDYTCVDSHDPAGPWWQRTPSLWWAFLTVPMYSLFLSLRLMAPWWKKEMILLIAISSIGWVTNHFVSTKFPNQSDISAAVGAFAVGFVSNMYGRFFNGNAFVVMITGILFQVPSGLGNGGLLNFVSDQTSGSSSSYLSGFQTALQLISVAIGLTVGLGISLVVVHPVQSRRRAGGLFSL
ncbi:DUF1212-domain-containing protein [Imleria badia]|nr:DUF1212-domain-containing protein [Imleria badia]